MTIQERNIKLKHYITCLKCELSGKRCEQDCITQFLAGNFGEIIENLEAISEILEQQPPVTPQKKIGKWIDDGFYAEGHSEHAYRCSECGEHYIGYVGEFNYCPNCKVRMVSK